MIVFKPMTTSSEWDWFRKRTSVIRCEDTEGLMAYDGSGEIVACCVADSFSIDGCSVHFAIEKPVVIKYGFFQIIARHLYNERGRQRLFGMVPENNEKALKLDKHIGFTEVARIPNALKEGLGYVILEMTRENCRWLNEEIRRAA